MNEITLKDYRCFHEEQTARLAPLTLLVGENSTGKTSFMAMVRVLWDIAIRFHVPDFKEEPYDLGSFDEIAHYRGGRGGRADSFEAAVSRTEGRRAGDDEPYRLEVSFGKKGTIPVPTSRRLAHGETWYEERCEAGWPYLVRFQTSRGRWERQVPERISTRFRLDENLIPSPMYFLRAAWEDDQVMPLYGSPSIGSEDVELLRDLVFNFRFDRQRPFASAPVRSKPRRTYDPARPTPDPEGDYVPMYLADLYFQDNRRWVGLQNRLEGFGKSAGLFDEISIKRLGTRDSEPFQLQVRKSGGGRKGPWRNLIDVGYGVSQALPVITELLRRDAPSVFLLQQPEVHLHPSAQAALGSLFCQVASWKRQLIIETHSDHLIDRVRMDVRDGKSGLKPDDVSILYFERDGLDVRIHSLYIDEDGNMNAPESYRRFFMEETTRSLGL